MRLTATVDLDEQLVADRPHPHALDRDHAAHALGDARDRFGGARGRGVGQRVDGAPAEPPAGEADEQRDDERRGGIRPWKPSATPPSPTSTAIDDHMSEPKCSASASSASLAVSLRHAIEQARAEEIDHDRNGDHGEGPERRFDRVAVAAEQPLCRLPDHHAGQHEQQRGLGERGDAFDLAVAVVVLLVGRLAGDAHREIGHHGRDEVDQRMRGLGQDRERAGHHADHALGERQPAEAAIDPSATRSFSLCIVTLGLNATRCAGMQRQIMRLWRQRKVSCSRQVPT